MRRAYFLCSSTTAIFIISTELPTLVHAIGDSQPPHTINQYLVTALILLAFMVHNLTAQRDQPIPRFTGKSLEYMGLQELSDMEYSKLVYAMKELFCFQPVFERPQPKSSKRSRAWGGRLIKIDPIERLVPVMNDRYAHLTAATELEFPDSRRSGTYSLPHSCREAIKVMLDKFDSLPAWRHDQVIALQSISDRCKPITARIVDRLQRQGKPLPEQVIHLNSKRFVNVAFLCLLVDCLQWTDIALPHDFLFGHTTVGEIPSTGVHRPQQPEFSSAELHNRLAQMEARNPPLLWCGEQMTCAPRIGKFLQDPLNMPL